VNCDRIARWYWLLERLAFGRALERTRFEYLDEALTAGNVLILGDGDGRFTAELVRRNPTARIDSVDVSAGMLKLARRRVRGVRFWEADARTMELPGTYDLVVTHFFLDCFTTDELESLVQRIPAHCRLGTKWLISEFSLPETGLRRVACRVLIRGMYLFFRIATGLRVSRLPEHGQAMSQSGFRLQRRRTSLGGLLVSELWEFHTSPA
jgi:ubiquinone/menaquinone biosynthesis C-methylase UbiE